MTTRKVTRNNQITIPKKYREELGIEVGDLIEIEKDDGKIVITKHTDDRRRIQLGKKLPPEEIEELIEEGREDCM